MGSENSHASEVFIVGDYGIGSYGPTIVLQLRSRAAAEWLRGTFLEVRRSRDEFDLAADPRVRIDGVRELKLSVREGHGPYIALECTDSTTTGKGFRWSASSEGWAYEAGLLDPFVEGRSGHQYLTREGVDDALVEVSFLEPHVNVPAAKGHG